MEIINKDGQRLKLSSGVNFASNSLNQSTVTYAYSIVQGKLSRKGDGKVPWAANPKVAIEDTL